MPSAGQMPSKERASDAQRASDPANGPADFPDFPDCLRRAPPTTNGHRPPRGKGWVQVGDKPPGQAGAIVFIKEVWPPALGPAGDDVFDIDPGWRQ